MKIKILFLGLAVALLNLNCSKNDENHIIIHKLTPPQWTIGKWISIDSNQPYSGEFIFSKDNVKMSSDGTYYTDLNEFGFDDLPGHSYFVEELIISENEYSIRRKSDYNGSVKSDQVYKWTKLENGTLLYKKWFPQGDPNSVPSGTDVSFFKSL